MMYSELPSYSPGFNVGVLGEARFTDWLSLRFIPTMYFGDKTVIFYEQQSGFTTQQSIKSTYFTVPVDAKWSAPRFNNYRPYVVAGVVPMLDLTVKKQKELLVRHLDFGMLPTFPAVKKLPEVAPSNCNGSL